MDKYKLRDIISVIPHVGPLVDDGIMETSEWGIPPDQVTIFGNGTTFSEKLKLMGLANVEAN